MGQQSRRKKERRKRGVGAVARVAGSVSRESLLALLEASSASPTACHRGASLALVFDSVMKRTSTGSQQASPDLLPELVEAANQEAAHLGQLEDLLPCDARLEVVVRWEEVLYRVLPSSLEQPVAAIEVLRLLAGVIDPLLVDHLGFGLGDAVELVLRRVDHVASVLASVWGTRQEALGAAPVITTSELEAARTLLGISEQVRSCRNPQRAELALEWLSVRPKRLGLNLSGPMSFFGPTIAVREGPGQYVPLPAGILIQSLGELGGVLAEEACRIDPGVEGQWKDEVEKSLVRLLAGSGQPITGPLDVAGGGTVYSAVVYSERQILALDVVACLRSSSLVRAVGDSAENLDRVAPGKRMTTEVGDLPISVDAQVFKLQLAAHPDKNPRVENQTVTNFKDFMWMLRTAAQHPEDLWLFLRDLHNLRANTYLRFVDLVDVWDMWRKSGKSFPIGSGTRPAVVVLPYGGEEQWGAASESAPVERALLALDMAPLSSWPVFENLDDRAYVGDRFINVTYQVLLWEIPVAVTMTDPRDPDSDRDTVWYLATAIVTNLNNMKEAFDAASEASGISALRVELVRDKEPSDPPVRLARRDGTVLTVAWNDHIVPALLDDSVQIEMLIGQVLAEVFDSPDAKQAFLAGWDSTPPSIRLDAVRTPAGLRRLPEPVKGHASHIAAVRQRLGEHLVNEAIESGPYEGERAKRLESEVIYPWALKELHRVIRPYSAERLVELALIQLEMANCNQLVGFDEIALQRGFPVSSVSGTKHLEAERRGSFELAKAISLILEETLACPPTGNASPDPLMWNEALSVAQVAFASSMRSEFLSCELRRGGVIITDRFLVAMDHSEHPTDVDMAAYERQRAAATLPEPIPFNTSTTGSGEDAAHDPKPLREWYPELAGIDIALQGEHGFGLDVMVGVLGVGCFWDVPAGMPLSMTTLEDFTDAAVREISVATHEECRQAIQWLTLGAENLRVEYREYWETGRRATRIETRPFVEYGSRLYILPWTMMLTLRILRNYLSDGRLPWPDVSSAKEPGSEHVHLGKGVKHALDRYRQTLNDRLEDDCHEALADTELLIVPSIDERKSERLYGIESLSGEIDLLAVHAQQSRIWVIEAKDPYTPFSVRQTRNAINQFHDTGKYVDKLLQKGEDIMRNAAALARKLEIEDPDREWEVRCLMVTRYVHPAAFSNGDRVPFCTLGEIKDTIMDSDPSAEAQPR